MKVDQAVKAQVAVEIKMLTQPAAYNDGQLALRPGGLYSGLGLEELMEFAGLDISPQAMALAMPEDVLRMMRPIASVTPQNDLGIARAAIKQGVRELILAKDGQNKIGVALKSIDKGIFVAFVWRDSAAAMAGLRFGDQILQLNDELVAGWSSDKAMDFIKKCPAQRLSVVVRDRPYERTVTVVKDSMNHVGFVFQKGEITALVKDSSACRNGLLVNHYLVEVNGQNVVGLTDAEIVKICADCPASLTLTIMPTFIFKHLFKSIGSSLKKHMDRSVPEF